MVCQKDLLQGANLQLRGRLRMKVVREGGGGGRGEEGGRGGGRGGEGERRGRGGGWRKGERERERVKRESEMRKSGMTEK